MASPYDALLEAPEKSEYDALLEEAPAAFPSVTPAPAAPAAAMEYDALLHGDPRPQESTPVELANQPTPTALPGPGNVAADPAKTGVRGVLGELLSFPGHALLSTTNAIGQSFQPSYLTGEEPQYQTTEEDVQRPAIPSSASKLLMPWLYAGDLAKAAFPENSLARTLEGGTEAIAENVASLTSASNVATLPLIAEGKAAQLVLSGVFGTHAALAVPQQWEEFQKAKDPAEKAKLAVNIVLALGLPAVGALHAALSKAPDAAKPSALAPETAAPETIPPVVVNPEAPPVVQMRGGGTRIAGPALVDVDGNVIAQGKLGETHQDLLNRAMAGPDAEKVLASFENDAQHIFLDDVGNVLNREQAAELGVKAGQLPPGTTKVHSQSFKPETVPPVETVPEPPVSKRKNNSFEIPYAPLGTPDIVDIFVENGGVKSRSGATPEELLRSADLWGDQPDVRGVYRQVLGGKLAPDEMAVIAAEHGFGDGTVRSMWAELEKAVQSRRQTRQSLAEQRRVEIDANKKDKAFSKEVLKPDESRQEINTSNLGVGDELTVGGEKFKVTAIDPDTLDVTLEDGKKYGVQTVQDGKALYVDRTDIVPRTQDFAPAESTEALPKLQPGEEQGGLPVGDTKTPQQLATEKAASDAVLLKAQQAQDARVGAEKALKANDDIRQEADMFDPEAQGDIFDTQGAIGPGGPATLSALPPAAVTRPIKSQRQIITDLAKGLNVPIRFGRLITNKFAGYFMPKSNLIGSKRANDLTTVTHEVGHKLDREFLFSGDKAIRSELEVLGDPTTPGSLSSWTKSKTKKYKYGEGIAEFVRYWLTDPAKALKDAPVTHAAFEKILDANKDVGDVLRQARDDIEVFRKSESQARVRSHISVGDNPNKTRYTLSQLTRDLVDDLHFVRLAVRDAKKNIGGDLPPSQNPYLLARNLRGSYGMADSFVRTGVADFKTRSVQLGTSLEDALKPISGRINDFRDWIVSKRAREMMAQGKETGLLSSDVAAVAKRFEGDADFQAAFKGIKDWQEAVLQYAVDSGLLTKEAAAAWRQMNEDFVPFHRVFEVGAGEAASQQAMGTGSGLNAGKPGSFKKQTGSTRQIVDPIETMIKNAYAIITASEKTAINNAVADLARVKDMGKWVERVAAPKEQVKVGLEKIKQQLEDAGADISDLPDDLALTFYRQASNPVFGENTIRIIKNGKPEFYRLNRDLFDTFQALDLEDSGTLIRVLASPAQLLRSGVVLEPSFAIANAMRDTFGAAVIGKHGALPFETTIRGLGAMIKNPQLVAEWAASGGKSAVEANYFDRAKLQKFLTEKITKELTPAERAMIVVKSPLTALRMLTGLSEEATRIGEYSIALNKLRKSGMPDGEARRLAAFEARDRQDFAKGGAKTKIIRHMAAFWNAGLQANVKLFQTFKERPIRTTAQGFAFITIPKLLEQAVNWDDQDYWDRPQWERDMFFLIPAGKDENGHTRFVRIPTPFEVGVLFGTLPGRVIQWAKQNGKADALTGYFNVLLKQSVPNPIPQSVQAVFEDFLSGKQGWDVYRGRPIVPDSLANQPPEMQWTEQTSALAKKLGGVLGYSPMKIDHMIGQTTGGLGKVLTGQQVPGKRFVTTPLAVSNQSTQDFYDTLEKLRADKQRSETDSTVEFSADKLSAFEKAARKMSELRRELRDPETAKERKSQAREDIYQIVQEVTQANP